LSAQADDVDDMAGFPISDVEDTPSERHEIFLPGAGELEGRWLEVRIRYLSWVDGHLAQMVISNDMTARKNAQSLAAAQAERAQTASRLITMGEMASSVAHELNQPLAAISNYCSGITSRLKNGMMELEDLLSAIEKTQRQAQRAGQIIQRIRSFVTRSAPNRTRSEINTMVIEAIELVGIEVQRRRVQLTHEIEPNLPSLMVDPILIEQVVVNLIKNAAESIDSGDQYSPKDMTKRLIHVRVAASNIMLNGLAQSGIECSVEDTGHGVAPEVINRIFDAFYSTKAEGMGIGLNLCRTIIESHHGRLSAENLYNGSADNGRISGCRFSFWLPLDIPPTDSTNNALSDIKTKPSTAATAPAQHLG
jgi:signal transduction histidine kinase